MIVRCLLMCFVLGLNFSIAQELPPVSVFTPQEYMAENQNWSIDQDQDKHIYIANNRGLLTFDGSNWRKYNTPNQTILRSVKVIDNKIFTGFYGGFGYWKKNTKGVLDYTCLSDKIELLVDEQFWNILEVEGWVAFQSFKRIYLYNSELDDFKIVSPQNRVSKIFKVDHSLYFQERKKGIYKLVNGEANLISDHTIFSNCDVIEMYNIDNKIYFITDKKGIWILEDGVVSIWDSEFNKDCSHVNVYSAIKLKNNEFVLGTIANGIFVLSTKGELKSNINKFKGLSNNTVLSLFEDSENNIWLGLDDGINVIDLNSGYKVFRDVKGIIGTIYASVVYNNKIYIGTNQGLFYKQKGTKQDFKFVKSTEGQVWCLKVIKGKLFVGHNHGTFMVEEGLAKKVSDISGTWRIQKLNDNLYIQGNYNGLNVFEFNNGHWKFKNKIKGFDVSSRYFEVLDDHTIFVNHEYKGVFQLFINNDFTEVVNTKVFDKLSKGLHSALLKYKNQIFYSYEKGVYKYNEKTKSFIKDSLLTQYTTPKKFISGVLSFTPKENILWGFTSKEIVCIKESALTHKPLMKKIKIPLRLRKGARGFENISQITDDTYLLGNTNGYTLFNNKTQFKSKDVKVKITAVINTKKSSNTYLDLHKKAVFKNKDNSLKIYCAFPYFNKFSQVEYSYKLVKNNNEQSFWSESSFSSVIDLKNIGSGNYVLNVKASLDGVEATNIAKYHFVIKKPWYASTMAIVCYVLFFIIFSVLTHIVYNRYYNIQKRKLLVKKQREILVQKLESDKKMAQLQNEKLIVDMSLKTRELANSTMNIVKNNVLLSSIKEELLKDKSKNTDNVIKIIDKNLNKKDDWQLFLEAFNNADKDFIKKIKTAHPSLTSNDLRLCAYLRLNLSSKEISPLLNISPKSVEVKRYRLRKKIDLSSAQSLSDYILSI